MKTEIEAFVEAYRNWFNNLSEKDRELIGMIPYEKLPKRLK